MGRKQGDGRIGEVEKKKRKGNEEWREVESRKEEDMGRGNERMWEEGKRIIRR